MGKIAVIVVLMLVVIGCASHKIVWDKLGATQQEFRQDSYECTQQAQVYWYGGGTGGAGIFMAASAKHQAEEQAQNMYNMCMEARGWESHEVKE